MEPRWAYAVTKREATFHGSFERFDLWSDVLGRLVVRWGNTYERFERYPIQHGRLGPSEWETRDKPTTQEIVLIEHYLSLFAPALGLVSRYTEDITNGT